MKSALTIIPNETPQSYFPDADLKSHATLCQHLTWLDVSSRATTLESQTCWTSSRIANDW